MNKDELLAKVNALVSEHQGQLDALKLKAQEESQEALAEVQAAIDDLEPKLAQARAKAEEIAAIADDAWDDVKEQLAAGFEESAVKLEEGAQSLVAKIKSFFS